MKKYQKEILKLTTRELLNSIFGLASPFFESSRIYRKSTRDFLKKHPIDHEEFFRKIKYWKRMGYIQVFVEGKEKYVELTSKGKRCLKNSSLEEIQIKRPSFWDGKWRIVIFDIPEKQRKARDTLRFKLKSLGFLQMQKSVYIFPFECTDEIHELTSRLNIKKSVLIAISEIIQGEKEVISRFIKKGLIKKVDIIHR